MSRPTIRSRHPGLPLPSDAEAHGSAEHTATTRQLLCLSTYPEADASIRERFLAYSDALREAGWSIRFESIFSTSLFRMKNQPGRVAAASKAIRLASGLARRVWVLARAREYDAIWIHREAFPFFTPRAETWLSRVAHGRLVLDFDDALYADPPSGRDWRSPLRSPKRYRGALACVDKVLAGSPELVSWAERNGVKAQLVPTCVDTERLRPRPGERRDVVTIGWIGSWSTVESLASITHAMRRVADAGGVRFLFIGAANLAALGPVIPCMEWRLWDSDREPEDLAEFDIGIMPMPDTEWNRGKCAYKTIQYMAVGIPFAASPVGMNEEVALRSGGGILCRTEDEWVTTLVRLVRNRELRERLGAAGRAYAVEQYDRRRFAPRVVAALSSDDAQP